MSNTTDLVEVKVTVDLTIKKGDMILRLPKIFSRDDMLDAISHEIRTVCPCGSLSFDNVKIGEVNK